MEFKDARQIMLNFYFYTEKQFKDFIDIVPLVNSPITYSPIMYNVLQSSCGQIENMMRLLCDKFELKYVEKNFPSYYKLLNRDGILARQQIALLKESGANTPFQFTSEYAPNWWSGYNDTKHNLPDGLQQGNLGNVTLALSGLFALHCIAYNAQVSPSDNVLKKDNWMEENVLFFDSNMRVSHRSFDERPKSDVFYCLSKYSENGIFM